MINEIKTAIYIGIALGACVAFIVILLGKWGLWDFLVIYTPKFLPWGCEFCLCFWLSLLLTILAFTLWLPFTVVMVLVPIISTAMARAFLR